MRGENKRQAGFSLAELLVAVAILAIGLLGLAELQVTAMRQNAHSSHLEAAASLAQMVVEDVMSREEDDPLFRLPAKNKASWSAPVPVTGAGTFQIEYSTEPGYQGINNLCKVTVYVKSTSRMFGLGSSNNPLTLLALKRFSAT